MIIQNFISQPPLLIYWLQDTNAPDQGVFIKVSASGFCTVCASIYRPFTKRDGMNQRKFLKSAFPKSKPCDFIRMNQADLLDWSCTIGVAVLVLCTTSNTARNWFKNIVSSLKTLKDHKNNFKNNVISDEYCKQITSKWNTEHNMVIVHLYTLLLTVIHLLNSFLVILTETSARRQFWIRTPSPFKYTLVSTVCEW